MSDAPKVRTAILGLNMGMYHLEILKKNPRAEVTTLCDLRADHLERTAAQHQVPKRTTDYREVLADPEIDAVVVALPVFLHAPVTLAALNAGKHVLVEKPMAQASAEAEAMLQTARKNRRVLTINHNQRFDPVTGFLKEYLASGQMGPVHFARCVWTRPYGVLPGPDRNWFNEKDKGGGVLFDLGTHLLDRVLSLFGFPNPVQFAATSFTVLGKEQERRTGARFDADDLTVGMIQFANGLTLQAEFGFGSHIERETLYFELYGEKGGATTLGGLKLFSAIQGAGFASVPVRGLPTPPNPTVPDDFVDAILARREPIVTPESGLQVIRMLEGLREAAARGWGRAKG
jgi:predicted dehydrogenase